MIQITPHMKILAAVEPIDFRKGIDAMVAVCKQRLQSDPYAGTLFVFRNKRLTAIRVFFYDGQGLWNCQKRISTGKFKWPTVNAPQVRLQAHQLQMLLMGGDPMDVRVAPNWRELPLAA